MAGRNFEEKLKFGKGGEAVIADWIQRSGGSILYIEKGSRDAKGPRIHQAHSSIVAPDLLALEFGWIEAKTKSAFTWHRISQSWQTGIDIRLYEHYIEAARLSPIPVYLFFLQLPGRAKDTPDGMTCPTGLYGGKLGYLQANEDHRSDRWGRSGMVYWREDVLKKFAELDDLDLALLSDPDKEVTSLNRPSEEIAKKSNR